MRVYSNQIITENSSKILIKSCDANYICNWAGCYKTCHSIESLASHVNQIHTIASSEGIYFCKWEGCPRSKRSFNARYKMLVHVRTHTKEKPHKCYLCTKRFSRAENLKIHLRSHSGEKPYVCPYEGCNKAYSNSSDRFKHTKTHATQKPYNCKYPGCQKRYTDPSSLRKHVKTFKHKYILHVDQSDIFTKEEYFSACDEKHNKKKLLPQVLKNVDQFSHFTFFPPLPNPQFAIYEQTPANNQSYISNNFEESIIEFCNTAAMDESMRSNICYMNKLNELSKNKNLINKVQNQFCEKDRLKFSNTFTFQQTCSDSQYNHIHQNRHDNMSPLNTSDILKGVDTPLDLTVHNR